jgi:hypothetical protein
MLGLMLLSLLLGACATTPPAVRFVPGAEVLTLSSSVNVAAKGGARSGSARGYLLFKRPDRLHVLFLSPFGSSIFELFLQGERVTCLIPERMVAYSEESSELAGRDYLATLRLMRWALARPPVPGPSLGARELETEQGSERVFFFANGLVQRKVNQEGEEVIYSDYQMVDGVPFAQRMEIRDGKKGEVKISFDDPEINRPVEDEALSPKLQGYAVVPLALLREAP